MDNLRGIQNHTFYMWESNLDFVIFLQNLITTMFFLIDAHSVLLSMKWTCVVTGPGLYPPAQIKESMLLLQQDLCHPERSLLTSWVVQVITLIDIQWCSSLLKGQKFYQFDQLKWYLIFFIDYSILFFFKWWPLPLLFF